MKSENRKEIIGIYRKYLRISFFFCIFARDFGGKGTQNAMDEKNISSLEEILSAFFETVVTGDRSSSSPLVDAMRDMYVQKPTSAFCEFELDDDSIGTAIDALKGHLNSISDCTRSLNMPLTYLLDELICNIQQHAQTERGYAYLEFEPDSNSIDIIIADFGITIYGSYAAAQKHLDKLGNSDAEALNLAQNGYSVKNLPNAENRGYGISSNIRMVVDGLHGEFAVLSGNALLLRTGTQKKILALPSEIDYKGTIVVVKIPAVLPKDFNL